MKNKLHRGIMDLLYSTEPDVAQHVLEATLAAFAMSLTELNLERKDIIIEVANNAIAITKEPRTSFSIEQVNKQGA